MAKETLNTTIKITVLPGQAGEPDAFMRLKQWLKLGLRAFRIRAAWSEEDEAVAASERAGRNNRKPERGEEEGQSPA